ncbi:hypothetical protein BDY19DRAFT_885194, partial [Irpex rosettiformis]
MFDAVKTIFTRQAESSDIAEVDQTKNTRLVITKIVNALTAQSEIGAPMAAMYLLNHPDHYTDHKFERFYWKRYINEVRDAYIINEDTTNDNLLQLDSTQKHETKFALGKNLRGIVGLSPVHDYMYRPEKYKDICLYDWIRLARKSKQMHVTHWKQLPLTSNLSTSNDSSEDESDSEDPALYDSIHDTSSKSSTGNEKNNEYHKFDFFLDDHPQCETHRVRVVDEKDAKVPDFIGGVLPRKDKGNREEYCLTMLSLFKPWRSGLELKIVSKSWSESFDSHDFSQRQCDIMNNFNLRYECRDARDDFAAQRKAKGRGITDWPSDLDNDVLDDMDNNSSRAIDINTTEFGEEDQWIDHASDDKSSTRQINRMMETEEMLDRNGLIDSKMSATLDITSLPVVKDTNPSSHYWHTLLTKEKEDILHARQSHVAAAKSRKNNLCFKDTTTNKVEVIDQSYFEKSFKPSDPNDRQLI